MSTQPMRREYIMLRPLVSGATGFARLEVDRGGLLFQLTCKNLEPYCRGLRVFLYAGEGAVQELGRARVNTQGQATLTQEVAAKQSPLLPTRLQAVLVTTDDAKPGPLFIGLCVAQSAGSLLDAKNALLALCAKLAQDRPQGGTGLLAEEAGGKAEEAAAGREGAGPGRTGAPASAGEADTLNPWEEETGEEDWGTGGPSSWQAGARPGQAAPPLPKQRLAAHSRFQLRSSTAIPRDPTPQEVFLSAIDPNVYVAADVYASSRPGEQGAQKPQRAWMRKDGDGAGQQGADEAGMHRAKAGGGAGVAPVPGASGKETAEGPVDGAKMAQPEPRSRGGFSMPVDRLRPLSWPARWQQLARYFDQYPPVMPFRLPGWRFARVPLARGGSFAVGRFQEEGRVRRVCYAVPGVNNQPPPREFANYKWQQGDDGQGYWVLWQQVRDAR